MVLKTIIFLQIVSVYIEKNVFQLWEKSKKRNGSRKKAHDDCGKFYAKFRASKVKNCLTKNENGFIEEKKTFESFQCAKKLLGRKLNVLESERINGNLPKWWKISSDGVLKILPKWKL